MEASGLKLKIYTAEHMMRTGCIIGEEAFPGCVVLLNGALGVGKTVMAQGIALGLRVTERPVSPTYIIMQQYEGRLSLYHFDMYRLMETKPRDIADLGFDEYIYGNGVCVIEWSRILPKSHISFDISYAEGDSREITAQAYGGDHIKILKELKRRL